MSNRELGNVPALGRLRLIDGQDFVHEFDLYGTLPIGTIVALEMTTPQRDYSYGLWPVVDLVARIDAADHAVVPNGSWFRLWTTYPDDGGRFCDLAGPVERNRR
jgi:hypothetical protein